jgi:hypothetical protein
MLNGTGDGTVLTIAWDAPDIDIGSNFSASTYTAPVTGVYRVSILLRTAGYVSGHTYGILNIVSSNNTFLGDYVQKTFDNTGTVVMYHAVLDIDMDAADTLTTTLTVSEGTQVVDVESGYGNGAAMSIFLAS